MKRIRIYMWDMYPMELNKKLKRFAVQLIHLNKGGTENTQHKNNKKLIRKSHYDAIEIAKKWITKAEISGYKIMVISAYDKLINE